jgi:hypothetical protein
MPARREQDAGGEERHADRAADRNTLTIGERHWVRKARAQLLGQLGRRIQIDGSASIMANSSPPSAP